MAMIRVATSPCRWTTTFGSLCPRARWSSSMPVSGRRSRSAADARTWLHRSTCWQTPESLPAMFTMWWSRTSITITLATCPPFPTRASCFKNAKSRSGPAGTPVVASSPVSARPTTWLSSSVPIRRDESARFPAKRRWCRGVTVHHVGGHTPGLQVVRIRTVRGHAVIASDASHFEANLREDRPFSIVHTLPAMYDAFDRVRELADDLDLIVPGHDPIVLQRFPADPSERGGAVVSIA